MLRGERRGFALRLLNRDIGKLLEVSCRVGERLLESSRRCSISAPASVGSLTPWTHVRRSRLMHPEGAAPRPGAPSRPPPPGGGRARPPAAPRRAHGPGRPTGESRRRRPARARPSAAARSGDGPRGRRRAPRRACSRRKRLTTPRAVRPVNARVSAVGAPEASASRCAGDVPASGVRISAVPSCAAAAPAASTAAIERPVARPPVATSGSSTSAPISCRAASRPSSDPALVVEAAAVAAGLHALHDERVRARVAREARLGRCRHGDPRLRPGGMEPPDHVGGRAAEHERRPTGTLLERQGELVLPAVVVAARLAERDARALALGPQLRRVGADRRRIGGPGGRREDVEPERPGGQPAQRLEVGANRVDRLVAGRQEAEPARVADRGGERGRGGAAGQRRLHDRELERVQNRHRVRIMRQRSRPARMIAPFPARSSALPSMRKGPSRSSSFAARSTSPPPMPCGRI